MSEHFVAASAKGCELSTKQLLMTRFGGYFLRSSHRSPILAVECSFLVSEPLTVFRRIPLKVLSHQPAKRCPLPSKTSASTISFQRCLVCVREMFQFKRPEPVVPGLRQFVPLFRISGSVVFVASLP